MVPARSSRSAATEPFGEQAAVAAKAATLCINSNALRRSTKAGFCIYLIHEGEWIELMSFRTSQGRNLFTIRKVSLRRGGVFAYGSDVAGPQRTVGEI
jgi:hypothetical protein